MLPGPQFPFRVPERLFRLARAGEPLEDSFLGTEAVLSSRRSIHDLLDGVVSRYAEANFLDPVEILCPDGSCITVDDGYPLYWDMIHLSYHGSLYAARVFDPVVASILESRSH